MQAKSRANPIEVAARLEVARRARGVGKRDVARAAGMTPSTYSQWISGATKSYDAEKLFLAVQFLEVRLEWILFGEEPMRISEPASAAASLVEEAPEEIVNETFNFMGYALNRSFADDPVKLGRYLKMIDGIMRRSKE